MMPTASQALLLSLLGGCIAAFPVHVAFVSLGGSLQGALGKNKVADIADKPDLKFASGRAKARLADQSACAFGSNVCVLHLSLVQFL